MKQSFPDFSYETEWWQKGYAVIGLDEVGRGCLAGPVTIGGVCFTSPPENLDEWLHMGINDSKKLSSKKRSELYSKLSNICDFRTASTEVRGINQNGIVPSIYKGMAQIVLSFKKTLPDKKIILLIDGAPISHIPYINDVARVSIVKGDGKCISIAAASILAKVERDEFMIELDSKHPQYFWKDNKGYGTLQHRTAIRELGVTPCHRTLFIRNILKQR